MYCIRALGSPVTNQDSTLFSTYKEQKIVLVPENLQVNYKTMYKKQSKGYKDTMRYNPSALSQHNQQPKQWQLVALFVKIIFFFKGRGAKFKGRLKRKQSGSSFRLPVKLRTSHPLSIYCCSWYRKLFLYLQWMDVSVLVFQYTTICSCSKIINRFFFFFCCYSSWDYNQQMKHNFCIDYSC